MARMNRVGVLLGAAAMAFTTAWASGTALAQASRSGTGATSERSEGREVRLYDVGDLAGTARLDRLATALNMAFEDVSQRIVAVTGSAEQHGAFQEGLQTVRAAAMAGRVSVEIEARRGAGAAPIAGSKATPELMRTAPLYGARTVAGANRPSSVSSIETISYVRQLIPVVGSQSAAYQTEVKDAQSGLEASVFIGMVREGRAVVRVVGKVSRVEVSVAPIQPPAPNPDTAGWRSAPAPMQQLVQRTRMIDAEVDAGAEPVVASVVDNFEGDGWLAITVRVISAP